MSELIFKWCHFFRAGHERHSATHCHDVDELIVFTEGVYDGRIGRKRFQAGPGDMVLYRAGQKHWEANDTEHPPAFYVITFKGDARLDSLPSLMHDQHGRVRTICQWLNEQWWWETNDNQIYPRGLLEAILSEIRHAAWSVADPFVEAVRRYLLDHMDQPLTTALLAQHFDMSRSSFYRRFQAATHMAPMEELRRYRLFHARTLLQTTALPTKEIARRIGFSGEAALTHLLRKTMNMTPTAVRLGTGRTRDELQSRYDQGKKEY